MHALYMSTVKSNKYSLNQVQNILIHYWFQNIDYVFFFFFFIKTDYGYWHVKVLLTNKPNEKIREKYRECQNHKPQPFPDTKRKRKLTNPNKRKSNKRTKNTKISSLFPKRGNRNTKRTKTQEKNSKARLKTNRPAEWTTKQQRVILTSKYRDVEWKACVFA